MRQIHITAAFRALADTGDIEALRPVVAAIADGRIEVTHRLHGTVLRAVASPQAMELAQALEALRRKAGRSNLDVADEVGLNSTQVVRRMNGLVIGSWPTLAAIVELLSGDAEHFRQLWEQARAQQRQPRT
ncbi:helix-turn-helix domain-containing protein [Kineosporia babensis]|uniref:Uncharacterized protein n=1 Tax=Kineosporia babensis TaxID=499548 RepID=A0A9X1SYL1_9ACTN|nr:hypothetical protein [Kineosporia babensis]MCD5317216.1 hypothetical protein [Kineosporia babensis]